MILSALLLSALLTSPIATAPEAAQPTNLADLYTRVMQLEEENRKLKGQTEELEHKINTLEQVKETPKEIPQPVTPETKPIVTVTDSDEELTTPQSDEPAQEFEANFDYMTDGNTADAKTGFTAFVKKYPRSELASEAYFWLGEIAFDEKNYNAAAINYLKGYKEFPAGEKAAESILKLATSLKQLGKTAEACQNFARFGTEFKNAHINLRQEAARGSKELACK